MIKHIQISDHQIAEKVLEVQKLAYRIEADIIGFDQIPPLLETLEELKLSKETYLAFYEGEQLAGVLSYEVNNEPKATVITICKMIVHPEHFKKGIASRLIDHLTRLDLNASEITVATGSKNVPAIQLYLKLGFKETHEIRIHENLTIKEFNKRIHPQIGS